MTALAGLGSGGVVLWSDSQTAMVRAAGFAKSIGARTLEQTTAGKMLSSIQNVANSVLGKDLAYKLLRPLWDKGSAHLCASSTN